MKKILVVSGQKYSKSNRSIDTITSYFIENKNCVEHLVFGNNKLKPVKEDRSLNSKKFNQLYSKQSYLSYLGIMGKIMPDFILEIIKKETIKTARHVDFKKYGLIVLETGKPLFLLDIIPKNIPVILRQSDPLEISIRSDRKYFKEMERKAIKRSKVTLFAHQNAIEEYGLKNKIVEWKSGFEFQEDFKSKNVKEENSLVYMGMFKLDFKLIRNIALKNPDLTIHIVGNYKDKINLINVKFHGYLEFSEYIKLIKKSKAFFIPYHDDEVKRMKKLGMTSKFYIPMSIGKPVITKKYGTVFEDIEKYNIFTYSNRIELEKKIEIVTQKHFFLTKEVELLLEKLKIKNRKIELEQILKKYINRNL